jgi:flavin-dependent dehydrogenase
VINEKIGILGGGLSGLTAAIHLALKGKDVTLIEKESYPHHKVCGEYVSNEVKPYLAQLGVTFKDVSIKNINVLQWSTHKGKQVQVNLPLGGFGISRYMLDFILYKRALDLGVTVITDTVVSVNFESDVLKVSTLTQHEMIFKYVIGAFGKRSTLDKILQRKFIEKKSKWLAVKAHYKTTGFNENCVQLHNFKGGYCGLSMVEGIAKFNASIISENPNMAQFFNTSKMSFEAPLTIAQVSFQKKSIVQEHILMVGDSAGLIHPLCGNGMAMAIHSAKLVSETLLKGDITTWERRDIEEHYIKTWKKTFSKRLAFGSVLQHILLNNSLSKIASITIARMPWLLQKIIKTTHGKPLSL